ncbi:Rrf2 family transcriptional regulator [Sphingobium sp. DEHP117]|uniref:RrF2 family transcriptional regulator n=1 Tax=Sphingobium sp. DEHP117 TaxID=2993436 RepID=UPI0027D58147|nr:Rrf2 family transcriptional regulator [Sphingobium sp. DEHP117]MDQ4420635.1 Rrf2 family transcriptional regulator [Sphingobium sp. DEHP117]
MQLTRHTDFALRVLLYLAKNADQHCAISAIAAHYGISHNHLMKVVHQLGKKGFVTAVRGRYGGIKLAREPGDINIGEVVLAMESDLSIAACGTCRIGGDCGLQGLFGQALSAFLDVLRRYSLADIAARTGALPAKSMSALL